LRRGAIAAEADRLRAARRAKINEYVEAGFDHVWLHQVWPDQEGFIRFFEKEVLPKLDRE
jgi:hypothetical protein